ncbi:MAG TPA: response regulator [Candidatus Acidoferrales bacterium]|nr:response regulator [Candidatus Acidoferrales bacterium]
MKPTKRVLIIDDDKAIVNSFSKILKKSNYQTDVATTGREALWKLNDQQYDIALFDLKLPDMDGTELLRRMKEETRGTVKIMITGFPSLESGLQSLEHGADAYLVKPVQPQELLTVIEDKLACFSNP